MDKLGLLAEGNPHFRTQFQNFFLGTQIGTICGILNLIFLGDNLTGDGNILFFRLDLIALVAGFILTAIIYIKLHQNKNITIGQYKRATITFLWLWSLVLTVITWVEGGLYSTLLISFPVILVFAALFTELYVFLSLSAFLSVAIIFMGLNHTYEWLLPPVGMEIAGVSRIISALVLTTFTGFVCWVFGGLLKISFTNLKQENQRVLQSQELIRKLADCDALTGLLNRNGADSQYNNLLEKINCESECIVAYFIDLDDFKNINDLFDHEAGDQLLITLSGRLEMLLGEEDFACRFGGDEFILILRRDYLFDVGEFANEIMKTLVQPHSILGTRAEITASIGIAIANDHKISFNDLCKKADMAMYEAKHSGKNKYHIFSDALLREYKRNSHILNCLKTAISDNLLDLHFQPIINLQSNQVQCVEALLRWTRENSDDIGPDEFIPIIESTELIHSIGAWVINEACVVCKKWQEAGRPLKVSVNVSALQLTRASFYQTVVDALEQNIVPPAFLEIELTEHSLIKEAPLVNIQLEALKTLGVSLAIDDFGTGYSNMGYLTRLQIDVIKLDRSFVSQITQSEEYRVVVIAIIKMAQVMGMKVVAEGIETELERDVLKGLNCDYGQGFLWSKAVPASDLLNIIDRGFDRNAA